MSIMYRTYAKSENDLNNPYILIEEEITGMLDERNDVVDNESIEEFNNV